MSRFSQGCMAGLLATLSSMAMAQTPQTLAKVSDPANTTDITTDLYVRHAPRALNAQPVLAHCRQMNVMVNGRMQSRRQCVTPADNF